MNYNQPRKAIEMMARLGCGGYSLSATYKGRRKIRTQIHEGSRNRSALGNILNFDSPWMLYMRRAHPKSTRALVGGHWQRRDTL